MADEKRLDEMFGEDDKVEVKDAKAKNEASSQKKKMIRDALSATIQEDSNFYDKVSTLSDSLKVVKTLSFGKGGSIIVDKTKSSGENRVLKPTSKIVGYRLQNIGDQPIKYTTMEYTLDGDRWVGNKTEKVAQPGEQFDLSRLYMTLLCVRPEISFTLSNGKIVAGSGGKKKNGGVDTENGKFEAFLESHYFTFSKDENGNSIEVNDDEVKLRIDDENTGKVKPEFQATFGNLNNAKEPKARNTKSDKITGQVLMANYVNRLIQGAGLD